MHGFKSFADRTVVDLDHGVTAIVGPNGCGKSNIADAIKWVLGEQSPKSLRATTMQDVLFEGADTRPAMGFCEVALTFSDCQAQLGTAFAEVEVTRRVERDGGSSYALNGKACRLKDIQGLFRDTGIGRVAYSFLQQGQIDRLLSSNPLERRAVFEEAAGISGFKAQRDETMRKLAATEENLARVGDILTEVASSMSSLKRQASKAVRARRLRKQTASLEEALSAYDLNFLETAIASNREKSAPIEAQASELKAQIDAREGELKQVEGALGELLEGQQKLANEIFEVKSSREEALSHARFLTLRAEETSEKIDKITAAKSTELAEQTSLKEQVAAYESDVADKKQLWDASKSETATAQAAHEQSEAAYQEAISSELELRNLTSEQEGLISAARAKLGALELEAHGLKARQGPIGAQRESLRAQQSSAQSEADALAAKIKVAGENRDALSGELTQTQTSLDAIKSKAASAKETFETAQAAQMELISERNMLEALNRRHEGFGEATKKLLDKGDFVALMDGLEIEPSALKAVEALLWAELDAVRTTSAAAISALSGLQSGERVALANWQSQPGETPALEGLTPAVDFIKASPALDFIKGRLEGCYVCADRQKFQKIVEEGLPQNFAAIASSDGAMVDARGLYSAPNTATEAASFLDRSVRLGELEQKISEGQTALDKARASRTELDHAQTDAEERVGKLRTELASISARLTGLNEEQTKLTSDCQRIDRELSALDAQTADSDARIAQIESDRAECQSKFDELSSRYSEGQKQLDLTHGSLDAARTARDAGYQALGEARIKEAAARHQFESAEETLKNTRARLAELEQRFAASSAELERAQTDLASYRAQATQKQADAESFSGKLDVLNASLEAIKTDLSTREDAQASQRAELNRLREAAAAKQEGLMKLRLTLSELETRRQVLVEKLTADDPARDLTSLDWRASLYIADCAAKADETSLDEDVFELPAPEQLAETYPTLDRDGLNAECQSLRMRLAGIGPINENALEDYRAQETRYTDLKTQADDLSAAKVELATALEELNAKSSELFNATFDTIRSNFQKTFVQLFGGGKADLVLSTPEDPLNSGIEIMARPPGTQLKTLGLLSGGQKTMTAVALLFAIYEVKPSPFCVLDELDAPLDEANIGRFLEMLRSFTAFSQFLIITHNKRTMAASEVIYGVTMQERGVSKLLSMRLAQAQTYSQPSPKSEESTEPTSTSVAEAPAVEPSEPVHRGGVYSLEEIEQRAHSAQPSTESDKAEV